MIFSTSPVSRSVQEKILEIVDISDDVTRSDLQGLAFVLADDVARLANCLDNALAFVPREDGAAIHDLAEKTLARFGIEI